jgi:hypothetical protein
MINLQGSNPEPLMSALGQKQTWRSEMAMSALPPKADIRADDQDVCFGPKADIGCFAAVATMDVAAGAVAIGAWTGYLPDIAAGMTVSI